MNQNLSTRLYVVNYKSDTALSTVIFVKQQINFRLKKHFLFLNILFFIMLPFGVRAQETLMGLTSNGGMQGKGTVFTTKPMQLHLQ